jgi:hypothetical protein
MLLVSQDHCQQPGSQSPTQSLHPLQQHLQHYQHYLQTETIYKITNIYTNSRLCAGGLFFPVRDPHSKFSIANQKDKDHWEDLSNNGTRVQLAIRPKTWKADDDLSCLQIIHNGERTVTMESFIVFKCCLVTWIQLYKMCTSVN